MPTYEYLCKACDHRFELVQKVSDPAPVDCPVCEQGPIQKIFTSVGVIFKGSGFHVNDYRKPDKGTDKPSAPPASESKPEPAKPACPLADQCACPAAAS